MKNDRSSFPAKDYINDVRADGGTIKLVDGGFQESYGPNHTRIQRQYLDKMYADPNHRERVCCELEAEAATAI
jgi:hypothetical protein